MTKQKMSKETEDLKSTINQLDLITIYRTFYPITAKHSFFSSVHEIVSRREQMLGHKTSLNKLKRIEVIRNMFTCRNGMKLGIKSRKKFGDFKNMWKLNNIFLNT